MNFEIDEFLATLNGLTRANAFQVIALKQDELMSEVSRPKSIRGETGRSYKFEISFLHSLGNEISSGLVASSTSINRLRINNVLMNLSN